MRIMLDHTLLHRGNLLLVNAQHPLKDRTIDDLTVLTSYFPGIRMRREAAFSLRRILTRLLARNVILPVSGYRTLAEQTRIYRDSLRDHDSEFTSQFVALPGHSEHETGLAIDLALRQEAIDFIRPYFPYDGLCGDFRKLAPDFGWIERYPQDKEAITGIAHEPWHFRYVGYPHARIMKERRLTLEEYISFLQSYTEDRRLLYSPSPHASFEIYWISVPAQKTVLQISDPASYQISGDNTGGLIVTIWREPHVFH